MVAVQGGWLFPRRVIAGASTLRATVQRAAIVRMLSWFSRISDVVSVVVFSSLRCCVWPALITTGVTVVSAAGVLAHAATDNCVSLGCACGVSVDCAYDCRIM